MLKYLNLFKRANRIVDEANKIVVENGDPNLDSGDWIMFFKTRSFVAMVMSFIFTILSMSGIVIPFGEQFATELVIQAAALVMFLWATVERLLGKKRVVWNKTQAEKAHKEAVAKTVAVDRVNPDHIGIGGLY